MEKDSKKSKKVKIILLLFAVILILCAVLYGSYKGYRTPSPKDLLHTISHPIDKGDKKELYEVESVVDGDTFKIKVSGEIVKVRLIGVDAPESVASGSYTDKTGKKNTDQGKTASEFTKKLLEGKTVRLEYDVQKEDQYGRILAYVYVKQDDGTELFLNRYLLEEGMAQVMTVSPNVAHADEFTKAQKKARKNNKGFWEDGFPE